MGDIISLRYDNAGSTVYAVKEVNSSFASCSMRVMYTGENRNGSFINRSAVEAALPSLRNVPIVAHLNCDTGEFGGHDVEVVKKDNGSLELVNLTEPVGVVPDHATFKFATEKDANGNEHEYLVIEGALLWKRQQAYKHLVDDLGGVADHSMEISVTSGARDDKTGLYNINGFEFTALCLLENVEPCFEGSRIEMYGLNKFKEELEQMMSELRAAYNLISSKEYLVEDIHPQIDYSMEGGEVLEEKLALVKEFGLDIDDLDFAIDDYSVEELRAKLDEIKCACGDKEDKEKQCEVEDEEDQKCACGDKEEEKKHACGDKDEDKEKKCSVEDNEESFEVSEEEQVEAKQYMLNSNLRDELAKCVCCIMTKRPWGEDNRYWMVDYDESLSEVYLEDCETRCLMAYKYVISGDAVTVDFESGRRMKWAIVEYDEGAQALPFEHIATVADDKYAENDALWSEKYQAASAIIETMKAEVAELEELRKFKSDVLESKANKERAEMFAKFADLNEVEAFELLRENCAEMSIEEIEEKCYAIRGRVGCVAKFSYEQKAPKIAIERHSHEDEPYGGLFVEYGKNI